MNFNIEFEICTEKLIEPNLGQLTSKLTKWELKLAFFWKIAFSEGIFFPFFQKFPMFFDIWYWVLKTQYPISKKTNKPNTQYIVTSLWLPPILAFPPTQRRGRENSPMGVGLTIWGDSPPPPQLHLWSSYTNNWGNIDVVVQERHNCSNLQN